MTQIIANLLALSVAHHSPDLESTLRTPVAEQGNTAAAPDQAHDFLSNTSLTQPPPAPPATPRLHPLGSPLLGMAMLAGVGGSHQPLRAKSAALTDTGLVREHNEDSYFADDNTGLYVVADGMGGHNAGEEASTIAVRYIPLFMRQDSFSPTLLTRLENAISHAHAVIQMVSFSFNDTQKQGMGTTVVAMQIENEFAHLAHVGDSRIYLWRAGNLTRLTKDHSLVQQQIDQGKLTPEEARRSPHRNYITRNLGALSVDDPGVESLTIVIQSGDRLILCSDGLTEELTDDEIAAILKTQTHPHAAALRLVQEAMNEDNEHYGSDNITAIVVDIT